MSSLFTMFITFIYFIFKYVNILMGIRPNSKVLQLLLYFQAKIQSDENLSCHFLYVFLFSKSSHVQFYWIMKIIDRQAKKFNKWRKICFQHLNILNPGLDFQRAGWARFKRVPDVQWPFFPSQHPKAYYAILNTLPIICPHVLAHFV